MDEEQTTVSNKIHEHTSALDREFIKLAGDVRGQKAADARDSMLAVYRALTRLADAARPITAACPTCNAPEDQGEYQPVNKLSGVWTLPECPTCKELASAIAAIDKVARKSPATARPATP